MAYRSFNQRFPKFKWVLLLAALITLPLTVFSTQNVSTTTEQHAAGISPAPKPLCPTKIAVTLKAPTGLWTRSFCASDRAWVDFNWNKVPGAFRYTVYFKYSDSGWIAIIPPKDGDTFVQVPLRGSQTISWYVKATVKPTSICPPAESPKSTAATVITKYCGKAL